LRNTSLLAAALVFSGCFATSVRADILGFNGPWDPVDGAGNLINGYTWAPQAQGESFTASLSPDHSTLTLDFVDLRNIEPTDSIFSNYSDPSVLPSGIVSYSWSLDLLQSGTWLMETDVSTTFPGGDLFGAENAGVYTGTASLNYTTNNYFSFGNIGFGNGAHEAILTLTNFDYVGAATAPEPGTVFIFGGGVLALAVMQRRRWYPAA
jgi:hypothetical protein